ncbi:Rid family hydrolase [Niveispirillum sp. KHB5.9]|uniref:Rid family hydrolase n=1 Tax=Niveispirillum sp. KHB5.9 TaxID=3400269 RepID=UPI003A849225
MRMHRLILALLACGMATTPALAGARQDATVLMSENPRGRAAQEEWGFADAVVTGDTVYLSGVVAGLPPGDTDLKAAYTRAMDHLGKILARAGVGWDDVVDMTTYHTDVPGQLDAFVAVKKNYIKAPFPAWTAIGITRLVPDAGITEIKLTARLMKK